MGTTTKRRQQSKRKNTSNTTTTTNTNTRQAAISFLKNITLGNEHELKPTTTSIASITESPTYYYQPIQNSNVTQYGTLSVSTNDNAAAKGILFKCSHSESPARNSKEQQVPISLKIDTRRRSNSILSTSNNTTPITSTAEKRRLRRESTSDSFFNHRRFSSGSSSGSNSSEIYKLTREDSERPIASEKIKKKSDHTTPTSSHHHHYQDASAKNNDTTGSMSFMSVFRYYKGIIRQPKKRFEYYYHHNHHIHYHSYFHQHLANMHQKHRKALSYGHFLSTSPSEQVVPNSNSNSSSDEALLVNQQALAPSYDQVPEQQVIVDTIYSSLAYDPLYLDDESTLESICNNYMISSQGSLGDNIHITRNTISIKKKKSLNQEFRKSHPDLPAELTLSKINAIKLHLVNVGKAMDLEISSVSHAFVYFEKLIQKQIVNKQNRKLLAACCLFLATKINEPKGSWFKALLEAIHSELGVNTKDVRDHEFAVFADLEFNLYVPISEFMPHFSKICRALEIQFIEEYLGNEPFYKLMDGGYEKVEATDVTKPSTTTA